MLNSMGPKRNTMRIGTTECKRCEAMKQMHDDELPWDQCWPTGHPCLNLKRQIDSSLVSTVFLHVDHGFSGSGPLWYETMIFDRSDGNHSGEEVYCRRYATKEEATTAHNNLVAKIAVHGLQAGLEGDKFQTKQLKYQY